MLVERVTQWIWKALGGNRIEVLFTLLVFVAVLLVVRFGQWLRNIRNLPPGPWGLPFVGYILHSKLAKKALHLQYWEMAKKYGKTFCLRFGTQLIVVLSDPREIRETFRREEFTGRPHTEFINILDGYGECRAQQIPIVRFISRLERVLVSPAGGERVEALRAIPPRPDPVPRRFSARANSSTRCVTSSGDEVSSVESVVR